MYTKSGTELQVVERARRDGVVYLGVTASRGHVDREYSVELRDGISQGVRAKNEPPEIDDLAEIFELEAASAATDYLAMFRDDSEPRDRVEAWLAERGLLEDGLPKPAPEPVPEAVAAEVSEVSVSIEAPAEEKTEETFVSGPSSFGAEVSEVSVSVEAPPVAEEEEDKEDEEVLKPTSRRKRGK